MLLYKIFLLVLILGVLKLTGCSTFQHYEDCNTSCHTTGHLGGTLFEDKCYCDMRPKKGNF